MMATQQGDNFFLKMAKNPAAKKVLLASLVAVGGSACIYAMYNAYIKGTLQENLSDAAFALIDFVPGGIGLKRGLTEGMDTQTTLLFVKDALYLTPAWPIVLAGDILVIAVDLGGAFQVQNQHEGLIDLLVYDGVFDEKGDRAKFLMLRPPDSGSIEKDGLKKFLFETKAVKVNHPLEGKQYWINNLSEVSKSVRDGVYIPADPVTQQLRLAAETQLAAINKSEGWAAAEGGNFFAATQSLGDWYFGFDSVCKKSPERWCRVFQLLSDKIREREDFVMEQVMIPQLIELAEAKKSLLVATTELDPKLVEIQKNIEGVRGSRLGETAPYLSLADEVRKQAEATVAGRSNDTSEQKSVRRGQHWQNAYDTYSKIWENGSTIAASIEDKSGWERAKPFQFEWTGDYVEDERRAEQSRQGFASELSKIRRDVPKSKPKPSRRKILLTKKHLDCLPKLSFHGVLRLIKLIAPIPTRTRVTYVNMTALWKRSRHSTPEMRHFRNSSIKAPQSSKKRTHSCSENKAHSNFSSRDKNLLDAFNSGKYTVSWDASPEGTFRPDRKSLKTSFSANRPEPVSIVVTIEKKTAPAASAVLAVSVPVTVPDSFLSLSLNPSKPKQGDISGIDASIPERFYGGEYDFRYRWNCENCEVDDIDRSNTAVTTPKSGNASVSCELLIADKQGNLTSLAKKSLGFSVAKTDVPSDGNTGDEKSRTKTRCRRKEEDDEKTAQTEPKETPKPEPSPSPSVETKQPGNTGPLTFGGVAASIWETRRNDRDGFSLERSRAKMKNSGFCKWEAVVAGSVFGKTSPSFSARTQAEIAKKAEEFKAESKSWSRAIKREGPFSIGEFKGMIVETEVRFRGGSASQDAGYRGDEVNAYGRAWLINEAGKAIEVGYNITGGGCFNNVDRSFLVMQAGAAQNEAVSILKSLTLRGGEFDKTAYTGPKLDGSDTPSLELVIEPNVTKLKKGDIVNVTAVVKNASADVSPITFVWTGDHAGKGADGTVCRRQTGKHSLSVSAEGAEYPIGSASVEFEVADFKAEINQISPKTAKIAVGVSVSFTAKLLSAGKPITGKYVYRFQPTPDVEFDTIDSEKPKVTAVFSKPGTEKVWVQILERKGNTLETVAESEQILIEVVEPGLKITFDQQNAMIGKPVKAKVDIDPADLKNIDFRWEVSSNAKQTLKSNDGKEITFIPQDLKPVTVKVIARVPSSGEAFGDETATITAQAFDVKVAVLGLKGPEPRVWKPGVGLVPVKNGIAVFQNVGMKVTVTPAAEDLRYHWTLNEDSHFAGGTISSEITANRSQTGTCEATVVVTDKNGVVIGRGTGSFYVGISQEDLDSSNGASESEEKLKTAKVIVRKGELDEAIALAEEAIALNPKNTQAKLLRDSWQRQRTLIETQFEKTRKAMSENRFPDAQRELIVAKNSNAYYKPTVALEKELDEKWRKFNAV